ncbi:MAG: DUF1015 domain-containing protein [Candidatus Omnitrophica bacterium]|nr:DUF1015 domain-containing protein [Candidatus Omnitrophota bacterium]MDD5592008.1 DUF1015 domain-containing protein [Candidatus Omnitrophota bacterium]
MAKIEPFRALIYNPGETNDLSSVVCPPYDVISPAQQQYYHDLNPHNFIHILLGKDIPGEDKYRRAAYLFKEWQKNKILNPDRSPAIYFYSQQYNIKGEKKTRLGFIARLYLEDKKTAIYGHEHTRLEPKEDRLKLLKSVKANLSPIFVIFSDKKRIISGINQHIQDEKPFIDIVDKEKVNHRLWRLDSPDILDSIKSKMQNESIFIADGHHRYEVSCIYRDEMRKKLGGSAQEADFDYTLAYFTNTNPGGLTILPIHRLIKLDHRLDMENFRENIKDFFEMEEIKDRTRFFFLLAKGGQSEHALGMYYDKKYWLLRLKNIKILDKIISDKPHSVRSLDVSILNHLIFKKAMGMGAGDQENIAYSPHAQELIDRVDSDNTYIAFFLNPVKIQQIISVALTGQKMPPKSTYFYPKVLSGLVINKHGD